MKIATKQYISNLSGSSTTVLDGPRCPTKEWISSNYNSISIDGEYSNNQLVKESSLSMPSIILDMGTITNAPGVINSYNFTKPLNPSKPFTIEYSIEFGIIAPGSVVDAVAVILYDSADQYPLGVIGVSFPDYAYIDFGQVYTYNLGNISSSGTRFTGVYSKTPSEYTSSSNLEFNFKGPMTTHQSMEISKIYIGGDPKLENQRDYYSTIYYLRIYQ